jgi:acetyltransferase-like isoleucine patch superfamily enzyme
MIPGFLGKMPETVGLPAEYFKKRGCFLDCRGPLVISAKSRWGYFVTVLTESHDIEEWPKMKAVIPYGVMVEEDVWIGSCSLLAGCVIHAGAIVAAGTVVRGQTVETGMMVAGNPARVIARWDGKQWIYETAERCGFYRELF